MQTITVTFLCLHKLCLTENCDQSHSSSNEEVITYQSIGNGTRNRGMFINDSYMHVAILHSNNIICISHLV